MAKHSAARSEPWVFLQFEGCMRLSFFDRRCECVALIRASEKLIQLFTEIYI
jgi:hypothetical protein